MARTRLGLFCALWVMVLLPAGSALARAEGPVPPCEDEVAPSPGPPGAGPVVRLWQRGDLAPGWVPPACSGWAAPGLRAMVAISGRLDGPAAAALPARLAAVSHFDGIRFWAVDAHAWQVLIRDAHAQDDAAAAWARADFTDAELTPGRTLHYVEADNGSGTDRYRMQVLARTPERLVVNVENTSTVRFLLLPLFHPGDLQALYVLERQDDRSWLFYSLTRIGAGASVLVDGHGRSLVNRAVAMYRYLAGMQTDQMPPAAP